MYMYFEYNSSTIVRTSCRMLVINYVLQDRVISAKYKPSARKNMRQEINNIGTPSYVYFM